MNQRKRFEKIMDNWSNYHTPGCSTLIKRPRNAVFPHPQNSVDHELMKFTVCLDLAKEGIPFITEACRNEKDRFNMIRRVDIVNLVTGQEIEIETSMRRAQRFQGQDVLVFVKDKRKWEWIRGTEL